MSFSVFVINLPSAHKRLRRMRSILYKHSIKFETCRAVLGAELTTDQLERHFNNYKTMGLQLAEYGCLLSHHAIWQKMVDRDMPSALILEDDVHLSMDFAQVIGEIQIDTKFPTIYRLETFNATVTGALRPAQIIGRRKIFEIFTNHGGTAGYILNKSAAKLLLDVTATMKYAVDTEMFDPDRRSAMGLRIMQVVPAICIQDMILPPELQVLRGDSSIKSRFDHMIWREPSAIISAIKKPLRPLARVLTSLALSRKGRRRIFVSFAM